MSDLLISIKNFVEGPIDYKSQKYVEDLSFNLLIVCAALASLIGFITQSIFILSIVFAISIVAVMILIVPPYPRYNKEDNAKLDWFQPKGVSVVGLDIAGDVAIGEGKE